MATPAEQRKARADKRLADSPGAQAGADIGAIVAAVKALKNRQSTDKANKNSFGNF